MDELVKTMDLLNAQLEESLRTKVNSLLKTIEIYSIEEKHSIKQLNEMRMSSVHANGTQIHGGSGGSF